MRKTHTHYDNLKITRNAPPEIIKAAYRALSLKFHPDKNPGDAEAARIMTIINGAYEVLSDPVKRQEYDASLDEVEQKTSSNKANSQTQPPKPPVSPQPEAQQSTTFGNAQPSTKSSNSPILSFFLFQYGWLYIVLVVSVALLIYVVNPPKPPLPPGSNHENHNPHDSRKVSISNSTADKTVRRSNTSILRKVRIKPNPISSEVDETKPIIVEEPIFTIVEQQAAFPGGQEALNKFLSKNIKYPEEAQRANVQGKVFLSFVVSADGIISDVSVLKGLGFGCDEEAIRVVKTLPRWTAGRQSGSAVNSRFNLPITFQLD